MGRSKRGSLMRSYGWKRVGKGIRGAVLFHLRHQPQQSSMLSFEAQKILGAPNILAKLTSLPFQQCQHSITTVDSQPSAVNSAMLVFVSGNLQLAGEQHSLKFSQMFHLIPTPQGSYYVLNDIFRLNYA
ncbi:hypothetical protein JHK87_048620 [Glycine soja]|nr:hypothetical protein JHK87_048620 [Glycine soja]